MRRHIKFTKKNCNTREEAEEEEGCGAEQRKWYLEAAGEMREASTLWRARRPSFDTWHSARTHPRYFVPSITFSSPDALSGRSLSALRGSLQRAQRNRDVAIDLAAPTTTHYYYTRAGPYIYILEATSEYICTSQNDPYSLTAPPPSPLHRRFYTLHFGIPLLAGEMRI